MVKQIFMLAMILALLLPESGQSQPPPEKPGFKERRRHEIEERIQTMKIWKLTAELQLSQEQATRFFPLMADFDRKEDELEQKRQQTFENLGGLVWDSDPAAKAVNQLLDDLEILGEEQMKLRHQFRKDVSGILRPEQMGKLVIFNIRFPEIIRDTVREMEAEKGPPKPRPEPPGRRRDW